MSQRFKHYSDAERNFLRANYRTMTNSELAAAIGRSESSVVWQLVKMKLNRGRVFIWTQEQIEQIRTEAKVMTRRQLAEKYGCNIFNIKALFRKHSISTGRNGHFNKGIVPPNKGKKMPEGWGGATRFKKGQRPHNCLNVGDVIVRKYFDGHRYKWVKIGEPNLWRPLSHQVYEQQRGEIPKGYFITFLDGNTMNCQPENLKLESKQEHMARNTIARFPPELISTIFLLNKFKRKVKSYAEKQN